MEIIESWNREYDRTKFKIRYARHSMLVTCLRCRIEWWQSEYMVHLACDTCDKPDIVKETGTYFQGGRL